MFGLHLFLAYGSFASFIPTVPSFNLRSLCVSSQIRLVFFVQTVKQYLKQHFFFCKFGRWSGQRAVTDERHFWR